MSAPPSQVAPPNMTASAHTMHGYKHTPGLLCQHKCELNHGQACGQILYSWKSWPGTRAKILVIDEKSGQNNITDLKMITTRVHARDDVKISDIYEVFFAKGSLIFSCGESTALEVLEVQLPGKKVVNAAAF